MHIMSKGFNKLHRYPNTDRLYFIFKSLSTNSFNKGKYLYICSEWLLIMITTPHHIKK